MPTPGDVPDHHPKCFGENDLDGILADYLSHKEIVSNLTNTVGENKRLVTWVTIEEICSVEWSIGGQANSTEAVPVPCRKQE